MPHSAAAFSQFYVGVGQHCVELKTYSDVNQSDWGRIMAIWQNHKRMMQYLVVWRAYVTSLDGDPTYWARRHNSMKGKWWACGLGLNVCCLFSLVPCHFLLCLPLHALAAACSCCRLVNPLLSHFLTNAHCLWLFLAVAPPWSLSRNSMLGYSCWSDAEAHHWGCALLLLRSVLSFSCFGFHYAFAFPASASKPLSVFLCWDVLLQFSYGCFSFPSTSLLKSVSPVGPSNFAAT